VACLRSEQGEGTAQEESSQQAGRYAGIAAHHLHAGEVRLVLVGGLPGTGKSTLSNALTGELGMVVLSSDRVRTELHGLAPHQPAAAAYQQRLYSLAATERTYTELLTRAGQLPGPRWIGRAGRLRDSRHAPGRGHGTSPQCAC
jgi:hypothetical protein